MRREGNLMSSTVLGLAKYLRDNIVKDDEGEFISIPECDFCIIDDDNAKYTLKELHSKAEGWYGLKVVNGGFNSDCLVVMSDYYGGGCANIAQIWNDGFGPSDGTIQDLYQMIENTLNERESASYDTILLVEFPQKKTKYIARFSEARYGQVEVEAETEGQADELANQMYLDGKVFWHDEELTDLTVEEAEV